MKPKLFVASASDSLDVSYAIQEELERDAEVTVWRQHFAAPTRTVLEELLTALERSEFGAFVFSPDDVAVIRGRERSTVRDNVLFELGLFVGRLGRERNFIFTPKVELPPYLPTDLIGVTTLEYDPLRSDGNLRSALGPACNRIRTVLRRPGGVPVTGVLRSAHSQQDIISMIDSWFASRSREENSRTIVFAEVDRTLTLPTGSAKAHLPDVATKRGYIIIRHGETTVQLTAPPPRRGIDSARSSYGW